MNIGKLFRDWDAVDEFEAGAVIDLLEMEIVRRRFAIRADELGRLREWVGVSGIRWGINAAWRGSELGIEPMEANSWQFGIDRMLMGYAVGDCPALVAGIAPSPAAALQNAELLGRFTSFTETLFAEHQTLRGRLRLRRGQRPSAAPATCFFTPNPRTRPRWPICAGPSTTSRATRRQAGWMKRSRLRSFAGGSRIRFRSPVAAAASSMDASPSVSSNRCGRSLSDWCA